MHHVGWAVALLALFLCTATARSNVMVDEEESGEAEAVSGWFCVDLFNKRFQKNKNKNKFGCYKMK